MRGYEYDAILEDSNPASAGRNTGLTARVVKFKVSKVVRLIGRLHSDLWHNKKFILPGIKLDVQLFRARPAFFINSAAKERDGAQVRSKVHIVSARFRIQFKELATEMVKSQPNGDE